jgi:hypothetical protein
MATTSNTPVAGQAVAEQGDGGKHRGRRIAGVVAAAALGLSLLAGVILGQGRPAATQAPSNSAVAAAFAPDQFTYREDRRVDTLPAPFVPDQFTYREDHR